DIDLGVPPSPSHLPAPVLTSISPGRPRAGDLVRIYGDTFDAIGGAACAPPGLPVDPCSGENAAAVAHNATAPDGARVSITIGNPPVTLDADVHAVAPTMVVFAMPVDCFAPASVVVRRGNVASTPLALCDPGGCVGRNPGDACDDQ